MGGKADIRPANPRRRRLEQAGDDPCGIELQIDLVGLQHRVSKTLTQGELLTVDLVRDPPVVSVVCRSPSGDIVGSLSAFRGLARMISCMEQGVIYRARVFYASSTRCAVEVARQIDR